LPIETHGAKCQAHLIRQHWSLESFHHTLDVAFAEDSWQTREANLVKNLEVLRQVAQTMVAQDQTKSAIEQAHEVLLLDRLSKHHDQSVGSVVDAAGAKAGVSGPSGFLIGCCYGFSLFRASLPSAFFISPRTPSRRCFPARLPWVKNRAIA
jgi:hypothetical protein